jgi:mRNA interferase YafQ
MKNLVSTPRFEKAFLKFARRNRFLQKKIENTLAQLADDAFAANLGTHKLEGKLSGTLACSCGYDCRILFKFDLDEETDEEVILLLDVGTHDEVY